MTDNFRKARSTALVFTIATLGISSCQLDSTKNQSPESAFAQQNEVPPNNFVVANSFVRAFYSFNGDSLRALLSSAESSQPEIRYYQKWADCAHYEVLDKTHNYEINDTTIALPITVKDDLMGALFYDLHVTDTFTLVIRNGLIRSVKTTSNFPYEYHQAREWVKYHRNGLVEKACEGIWAGASTPCECVQAMIRGFAEYRAAMDPSRPAEDRLIINFGSNMDVKIDTISDSGFDQTKKVSYRNPKLNGDSLVRVFAEQFKDVITLTDSCLTLKGSDKELRLCRNSSGDDKGWTSYDGFDYDHGYLVVSKLGYESSGFVCFNPITRHYAITPGRPHFVTNDLIYAVDEQYGDVFKIVDTKHNKRFGFMLYRWEVTGYYQEGNSIFIEYRRVGMNGSKLHLRVNF